jgi:DNA polymerase elongation subunit (family B)
MINIEQTETSIKISYYDKEGNIAFKEFQVPRSEYYEWRYVDMRDPRDVKRADKEFKSWDGKLVKKVQTKVLTRWRVRELIEQQSEEFKNEIFSLNMPKKFFLDIETEVPEEGYGAINAEVAAQAITALSFCHNNTLCVLAWKHLEKEQILKIEKQINKYLADHGHKPIEFVYISYKTEFDMLYTFMQKWTHKMPIMTGWNFVDFDWQYITNRCKRLGIDPAIASPSHKMTGPKNGVQMPMHRLVVDYMALYKKWDRVLFHENATLQYVAMQACGMGKIPYSGTLQDLYESDYEKYVYYNAIDSVLVKLIDDKISTLSPFLALGAVTKVEANQAFSAIALTETTMFQEAYKRKLIFPSDRKEAVKEDYEGAFVFKPVPGIYDWVASFDFASLYPSIMRQWNISPESFLGKANSFEEIPDGDDIIKTTTGAYFDGSKDSIFRTMLTNYYGQRKAAKKIMLQADEEIDRLERLKEKLESR